MKNYVYYTRLLVLFLFVGVYTSCNQKEDVKNKEITTITPIKEKKKKKDPNRTLGIEHMAQYQKEIRKPIDAEKSTYKEGYLMAEFRKAKNNSFRSKKASTITDISERGPANVPGRTRGIAIAPDSQDKWYIGTVGGGIWVTEDAGVTWATLTDFKIPSLGTSTIVASQTTAGKLYVGTGEPFGNLGAIGGVGILKTIDDGTNWEFLANTAAFGDIGRMVLNPMDDDNLIVASASGIYVTTDGGTSWANTYAGGNVQDLNYDPNNNSILYAGVNSVGVIKSTDGGLTWTLVLDRNNFNANHARFELDISNSSKVFVSVYTAGGAATTAVNTDFYVSTDAGATFTLLGFSGTGVPANGNTVSGQGWYDNVILAHPTDDNIFYSGGVYLHKVVIDENMNYTPTRIAGAQSFETDFINSNVHVDQHNLIWDIDPTNANQYRLVAATDGGIFSTDYGTDPGTVDNSWSAIASNLNSTQFYGADKQNGADNYLAGAQDNGSWISNEAGGADETTAYIFRLGGDGFEVVWNYEDPTKFIVGSQFNNFAQYNSVQPFLAPHGDTGATGSPFYSKVTNANNNPDVVFSPGKNGVWRSTDFAENWVLTPITSAYVPNQTDPNSRVSSALDVEVSVANPNIVWAGVAMTESGSFAVHVSQDNGLSFAPAGAFDDTRPDVGHNYFISGIEASPTEPNRAYVLFSAQGAAKILKTEDLGQTWTDISGFSTGTNTGFPDVAVHSLIEMPYDANTLWAGTDIGLFESTDGGANWALIPGLPTVAVYNMKIVNDQVVTATYGRGIWTFTLEELDGYEPVTFFAPPTIVSAVQAGINSQNAIATFSQQNENVESVTVFLDGAEVDVITENIEPSNGEISYTFENLTEGPHTVGFKVSSATIESIISEEEVVVIDFAVPSEDVSIEEFVASDVYTFGGEFVIDNIGGITDQNVLNNSEHPYVNGTTYNTVLKRPIIVSSDTPNFTYEDVAMVEPGDTQGEWDLVFIEASTDLSNWVALDVYDARRFPEWLAAYGAGTPESATITDDLFRSQTIDLTSFFSPGDEIVVRFRLFTDEAVQSFGWAIRNINKPVVLSTDDVVLETTEFKVYPTASFGDVTIRPGKNIDNSVIEVFGLDGKRYFTDNANLKGNAEYKLSLSSLSPGFYLVAVSTKDNSFSRVERIMIK